MLRRRVIVCLDVDQGRVVKGVSFRGLRDVGDPVELAQRYEAEGADEIVYLDISASAEGRRTLLDVVRRTAETLFIPLAVGGGIHTIEDVDNALRAGADKVSVNTAAVRTPDLLTEAAGRFGSQCIILSIDAERTTGESFAVFTHGGRTRTELDAVAWARRGAELGAGEIMLTSIDRDGRRDGYDLDMTGAVVRSVSVPVIASGGAGNADHMRDAFLIAGADAALAAGIFHDSVTTVVAVKQKLAKAGVLVRSQGE